MKTNDPIQVLIDEHEVIRSAETTINALDKSWEKDENRYAERTKQLIKFFREFSDHFHHGKEEEVLFKELKNNSDFLLPEIIAELEEHHLSFRETVAEIEGALQNRQWAKSQSLLSKYINDLLDHIAVENDELFIMAESLLGEEELERMYFRFEDIDRNLGKARKKELEGLLKNENQ